jgi:hypothetical protein
MIRNETILHVEYDIFECALEDRKVPAAVPGCTVNRENDVAEPAFELRLQQDRLHFLRYERGWAAICAAAHRACVGTSANGRRA